MTVYGTKDDIQRFFDLKIQEERLQWMQDVTSIGVCDLSELESFGEPIVLLDTNDAEFFCLAYRQHWLDIYVPVCGTLLSFADKDADEILNSRLQNCTKWRWHKEANRFRMLRSYLRRESVLDSLPSHIQLEHTSYCNAACIMCGHAIYGNRGAQHISEQMIRRVESLLPTCEVMVLHGYGEPFLTENLLDILDLYQKYDVAVTTNTNLSYLPDPLLERLAFGSYPLMRRLRISCDGVTQEVYEGIRPGLRFETFLNNLERLHRQAPQIECMMETVIMRQNVEQLPQMVRFAKEHGFSQISFNRLGSHPMLNNAVDCLTHYPNLTSHLLKEALEEGERLGIAVSYPVEWLLPREPWERMKAEYAAASALPFQMEPLSCPEDQKKVTYNATMLDPADPALQAGVHRCRGLCDSLLGRTNLDLEGNVYACCINTRKKIGNLFSSSDEEFYNAPALVAMRESFYRGHVPQFCDTCTYVMNQNLAFADIL